MVAQSGAKLDDFFEESNFFSHILKDVAVCLCPLVPDYVTFKERISCTKYYIAQYGNMGSQVSRTDSKLDRFSAKFF